MRRIRERAMVRRFMVAAEISDEEIWGFIGGMSIIISIIIILVVMIWNG